MNLHELINELDTYLCSEDYYSYISNTTKLLKNELNTLKVYIPIKLVRLTNKHSYINSGFIDRLSRKEDGNTLIEIVISNTRQFICIPSNYSLDYQLTNPIGIWKRGGYTFYLLPNEYVFSKEYIFERVYKKEMYAKARLEFLGKTLMLLDINEVNEIESIAGELMSYVGKYKVK